MSKLTNGQLVALSSATQRKDGAVDLPKHLRGGAAMQVVTPLRKKKLVKEIQAKPDMPVWRRDEKEGLSYALVITQAGRDAIDIKPDNRAANIADQHAEVTASRRRPPNKIKTASGDEKSTPKPSGNSGAAPAPRTGSKLALVVKMLGRVHGVSIDDLTKATEWLPHTARAVITSLRNKGYRIETERNPDKKTVYQITAAGKTASHRKAA
jgi:uncharacterized protein DUF3489